jgi:hypothetical protein
MPRRKRRFQRQMQYARIAGCDDLPMTNSYTTTDAAAPKPGAAYDERPRSPRGVVSANAKEPAVWRWMLIAAAAWCIGLPAAHAQGGYPDDRIVVAQRERDRDAQRRDNRRGEQRERRREADRQQRESLTPDEHRDLNRDLERANREIYRKGRDRR